MGDPCAVAAIARFTFFVLPHAGQRIFGHDRVAAVGDKGGHAADGVCAALVTGAYQ